MGKDVKKFATAKGADNYIKKVRKGGDRATIKYVSQSNKPYWVTVW